MHHNKYILIEVSLFTAQMRSELNNKSGTGGYIENSENTLRQVKLLIDPNPKKFYYVLKWRDIKPSSVLPRYSETGNDERINKIMTEDEINLYLLTNEDTELL